MAAMATRMRIDRLLAERGLVESREKAAKLIMAGDVFVDGERLDKAGALVATDVEAHVALDDRVVIATCRLRFLDGECKLERMAVERPYRGAGVGRRLLEAAEDEARRRGASEMLLHAQRRAEGFYAAAGYVAEGETFIEEGIEHVRMRKAL